MKKFLEKLKNKWLLKGTTTIIIVALVIACYIGANWLAGQVRVEDIDFTEDKLYSLSDETRKRLNKLEADITIQLINMDDYYFAVEQADRYKNASKKITVEKVEDFASRVDLQTKYNVQATDSLIIVKNGDREKSLGLNELYTYVSSYESMDISEEAILNAIIEVTIEEKPRIYVLSGKEYYNIGQTLGIVASRLMQEANEIEVLDINTKGSIPEDCDCLIITTLKNDLSELERDKILEYINNGGKILMLTSQGIINTEMPNLNLILGQYGVKLGYGTVLEQEPNKMLYEQPSLILADASVSFMDDLNTDLKLLMANPGKIQFEDVAKLEELGITYETIASTSEKSFVRTKFDTESNSRTEQDSEEGANIVAALVSKKLSEDKKSELIIYSDEKFISPIDVGTVGYMGKLYSNENLVLNSISYLTERDDTITIRKSHQTETFTVTKQEDLIVKTIIFAVPGIIMIIGIGVWFYRKKS